MTSSRRTLAALAFVSVMSAIGSMTGVAHAQPSAADLETARTLNKEGKELRARGDLQGALVKLRAAHELGKTPITGIELAKTQVMLGQLVEARETCLGIARVPIAGDETERSSTARDDAAKLAEEVRPRIATVVIKLTGVPAGKLPTLLVDRIPVAASQVGEARKVNPGKHEIAAKQGQGAEATAIVEVNEAETKEVVLEVPPEPAIAEAPPGPGGPQPPPGPATEMRPRYGIAVGGFVIAGAGLIVGTATGFAVLSKKDTLEGDCPNHECGTRYRDDLDSARTLATVSTVAFVLGGIGVGVGLYGLLSKTEHVKEAAKNKPHVTPWIGAGSLGVNGAF
jgi:hypothetical protein